ncbi:MAG: hypothetical protein P8Y01_08150 [Woeseiaceae bacterium]
MAIEQKSIEQKYSDLVNAAIDGEISADEQAELDAFLANSAEGRALYEELASVCGTLDGLDAEEPPNNLRHVIMNSIPPTREPEQSPGFWQGLLATPALKYAATFAAGVFLALSIVDSSNVSSKAFDDVTGLVGTVGQPVDSTLASTVSVDELDVAGTVSLRSAGSLMILDFDPTTRLWPRARASCASGCRANGVTRSFSTMAAIAQPRLSCGLSPTAKFFTKQASNINPAIDQLFVNASVLQIKTNSEEPEGGPRG